MHRRTCSIRPLVPATDVGGATAISNVSMKFTPMHGQHGSHGVGLWGVGRVGFGLDYVCAGLAQTHTHLAVGGMGQIGCEALGCC